MQAKCQSTVVHQIPVELLVRARVGQHGQNAVALDNAPPMTRYDAVTCDKERGCGVQPDSLLHGLIPAYPLEQKTPQISLDVFPWLLSRNMDSLPVTYWRLTMASSAQDMSCKTRNGSM